MVIISKKFNIKNNEDVIKIHYEMTNEKLNEATTIIYYEKRKFIGYAILIERPNYVILDWLYGPNYEHKIMEKIETELKKKNIDVIKLKIYIDPKENKDITIRRINFYINFGYNIYDIKYLDNGETALSIRKDI